MINNKKQIDTSFLSVGKDLLKYIPSKIIPGLSGFIAVAVYTRLLNPNEYGIYILALTTITIIEDISFRWLRLSNLRYFEEYKNEDNIESLMSTTIISFLYTSVLILSIFYITIFFLKGMLSSYFIYLLRIGGILLITLAGYGLVLTILSAQRKSFKYSIFSSLESIGRLTLAIVFLAFFSSGPEGILWAICITTGIIFFYKLFSFNRKWSIRFHLFSINILKKFVFYGFPLIGALTGMLILNISDKYMIQYLIGTEAVGIYSAGYKIVDSSMVMFTQILLIAATPVIYQSFAHKKEDNGKNLIENLLSIYSIIAIPIVFGITALSKSICSFLLGQSFQKAYVLLPWVGGGLFFWGLTVCLHKSFEVKQLTRYIAYIVLFSSILNIILNFFLIQRLEIIGAAIATFVSYFCCFCITIVISKKILPIKFPLINFIKSLLAASCMFIMIFFILSKYPETIFFFIYKIVLGAISYFIFLGLLKEKSFLKILKYIIKFFKTKVSPGYY